jgi:hypothetical protein
MFDDDTVDELPPGPRRQISAGDLKLLQLAARAIGAVRVEEIDGEEWVNLHFEGGSTKLNWNPLLFSDDTLELAASLDLTIVTSGYGPSVTSKSGEVLAAHPECANAEKLGIIKRQVVRAAAERGKRMK